MIDIVVIGSGPAGMGAALYAGRAGQEVIVIEKEYLGTGQIVNSMLVDNYLGLPGITGEELGSRFREHVLSTRINIVEGEVTGISETADGWKVYLENGKEVETRAIIYAAGTTPKRLEADGETEFFGKGISYCANCDGSLFRKKDVAVIGGGDTACDDALYLSKLCRQVYLIHRRKEFRASFGTIQRIEQQGNIQVITESGVEEFIGTKKLEAIHLKDGRELKVDGVFIAIGSRPDTELVKNIVELDEQGYIKADENGITTKEGFYAAGDVRTKRLRQVITAVSDGANAAQSAIVRLNRQERIE